MYLIIQALINIIIDMYLIPNLSVKFSAVTKKMVEPIVDTCYGRVLGKTLTDIKGGTFYGFQGIPYAKPPLGDLRFKAPQPPDKWTDVRDARKEASVCYQRHQILRTVIGSEDCLYLNVYTPHLPTEGVSQKPVMFWIHGGAFTGGSGNADQYGPELLISEDIVIVTINYRVGLLGFLSLDDIELNVPGNAGLKDMVFALKWVQQNIMYFNGDPGNVTIFGESAGAVSVHLLMISPMSEGLFHKAIAQSGCALNHWSIAEFNIKKLCQILSLTTNDKKVMLDFLQKLSVEELHKGQELLQEAYGISRIRPIGPVIEKDNPQAFLSEFPLRMVKEGRYHKVPLIIGYNNREGMFFDMVEDRMNTNMMVRDFETVVPKCFNLEKGSEKSKEVAGKIKEFFYGDDEVTVENKDKYYQLETDFVFLRDIYETIRLQKAESPTTPLYMYRFSVDAKLNFFKRIGKLTAPGAAHGDEMGYLFKMSFTPNKLDATTVEGKTIYRMIKFWTSFARTGDPNPETSDQLINVKWEPVMGDEIHFLDIGQELISGINPDFERIAFWNQLYEEYECIVDH